jgi:integrase
LPKQARPQLLGHDLDHRPSGAVLSRPAPLLESTHDHDRPGGRRRPAVPARYRALVLVAAFGGLRWGELAGLRRKRVDLERGTVTVAEQLLEVNGAFSVGLPKSAAGRRAVSLPAVVVEALGEHLRSYTAKSPEAFVFLSSQGTHLRRSNFNRRVWQPATRAAGVEGLRVHDLRHTAGTLATAAGGSLREVMDRLGHSTTVAAVRYQHVMADRDAAIARELNRLIEGA